ncbi:glycosyltransferase [Nibribacter ruber]|uniref:Glycosyltransferase n=1 Tax=Nibribacter ruber TaxID=2698458 RepID=A0A6P1NXP8_9BACT|nr:glycosyltransferase [Nibribacter ruber]QHL86645.1 glycosyltransferase [Nibribacter ruber]
MLFSLVYFVVFFLFFLLVLYFWLFRFKGRSRKQELVANLPKVSILIAARNEEAHILTCLAAIDRLDYPKDKLEVIVGDDRSEDQTRALVEIYRKDKPYLICLAIEENLPGLKGKANVLAQLAHHATSDYFFITDADIEVPRAWVQSLLAEVQQGLAIVTGTTTVKGQNWFARMQSLDWLYSLGLMQVVADRGLPVSCMGNNMVVTRQAYEAVGGFEGLPFSITEDVQLFKHVVQKGFKTGHVFDKSVLALSLPIQSLMELLHQRKRWMLGASQLPWYIWALLVFHSMYYPVWLPFFLHASLGTMALIGGGKVLLQSIFIKKAFKRADVRIGWQDLLYLEGYLLTVSLMLLLYFFLPFKINWKGRLY